MWGGAIAVIKIGNIIWGYVTKRQFTSLHTTMNKATGLLLFLLPLTMRFVKWEGIAVVVLAIATFAAIQEGAYVIADSERM